MVSDNIRVKCPTDPSGLRLTTAESSGQLGDTVGNSISSSDTRKPESTDSKKGTNV